MKILLILMLAFVGTAEAESADCKTRDFQLHCYEAKSFCEANCEEENPVCATNMATGEVHCEEGPPPPRTLRHWTKEMGLCATKQEIADASPIRMEGRGIDGTIWEGWEIPIDDGACIARGSIKHLGWIVGAVMASGYNCLSISSKGDVPLNNKKLVGYIECDDYSTGYLYTFIGGRISVTPKELIPGWDNLIGRKSR